ncbi:PepSY-associated TM helix domain-containing protein [Mycolicibacterium conceptionense]|uniref:PepSY-associated TM helix domain-containing protein n=1 Tax=Mycolicibacterium conceptionense TaxID=451644 RepID=A0A0U1DXB6_9MYCO|nr:PepSY-associated TM helix domain-containing protein [Mycolicibacterium conceptionense]
MSNNAVAVDGATATVTDTSWFSDWPLAAKLSAWGIQLHMGLLFGIANQLLLLGLALALVTVIVRGYRMWWQRRPTAGRRPVGSAPRHRAGPTRYLVTYVDDVGHRRGE